MKTTEVKRNQIQQDRNQEQNSVGSFDNARIFEKTINGLGILKPLEVNPRKARAITIAISAAIIFTGCSSPDEKVKSAKEDVTQANKALDKAQKEHATNVELFRVESHKKITGIEKEIAEINVRIKKSNNKQRAKYEKQMAVLEQKNKDLKLKIDNYNADTNKDWELFKDEFNKDMNKLGSALKNFTIDNK